MKNLISQYLNRKITYNPLVSYMYGACYVPRFNVNKLKIRYEDIISFDNLREGLARTKSGVAPGLDGEVKSSFTEERLQKLARDLKTQKYIPKVNKKVQIPKPDGSTRPLGIASQVDKVVQGAILTKLEPVLEKVFSNVSYGFRPGRGCHDALKTMKGRWQSVTWIIDADISKCFDRIHHELLFKLLSEYCDQATVELIRKLLKVGYVDIHNLSDRSKYGVAGAPRGSLISPILCNLFFHELDKFAEFLAREINRGHERMYLIDWKQRAKLTEQEKEILKEYPELRSSMKKVKHKRRVIAMKASRDPDDLGFRRFHYVRYADDFIIGFCGPKKEADDIMEIIKEFLETIHLSINEKKSKIFHSSDRDIKYLGMYIRYINKNKITEEENSDKVEGSIDSVVDLTQKSVHSMQMRAPIDRIMKRAVDKGFAKFRADNSVRATSCRHLASLTDAELVNRYSVIIRGILNYYSCVNQRSDLWAVVSLYRKSLALTLGDKHKMKTAATVFRKYGPNLKVQPEKPGGKVITLYYPETLKTKLDFKTGKACVQAPELDAIIDKLQESYRSNPETADICGL